jgi:VIT1/CCC1 family predicted Fe2+/Mn2+ transporter
MESKLGPQEALTPDGVTHARGPSNTLKSPSESEPDDLRTKSSFLWGAVLGFVVAAAVYYVFYFVVPSPVSNLLVSGVTLVGIGLAIGGYYTQWKGDRSPSTYFLLGFGAGIIVVAFVGVGSGVSPAYYG